MCGIVGARHDWLVGNGLDPEATMRAAVASLAWRGPDGQGVVRAGAWWLGCARLAIGPAKSRQPLVRRGGRFACVMNGAITNARELWAHLLPGVEQRARLPNDAWLPLLAVERGNDRALWNLRGHHAYAVADGVTGDLMLGRDRFGEKPLRSVVERTGGASTLVAFASTPGALRQFGVSDPTPTRSIAEWFRFGWFTEREIHLDRRRVLAVVQGPGPHRCRGSAAAWHEALPEDDTRRPTTRPSAASVRDELIASVARCVDTRVPVALSLSGGLDSSCLAMALHANGHRMPAYQLRAAGTAPLERGAALVVAARAGLELRAVDVDVEVLDALPHLTACAGRPLGDPSILAVHAVARAANADGVRVLLGGEGADELFLGYRRYRALASLPPRAEWLRHLTPRWSMRYAARWLRAVAANDPVATLLAVTPPAFADTVLSPGITAPVPDGVDANQPFDTSIGAAHARGRRIDLVVGAHRRDVSGYLRCDLLPKVDVATMAAGIEARCPYLEGDFATIGAGNARRLLGKRPLREAFATDLPAEVLRLPKTGFALPLDRWFRGDLPWLDLLAEPRTQRRDHLRPGGVARVVDLHRSGRADLGHGLYLLIAYELFLRADEDSRPERPKTGPNA